MSTGDDLRFLDFLKWFPTKFDIDSERIPAAVKKIQRMDKIIYLKIIILWPLFAFIFMAITLAIVLYPVFELLMSTSFRDSAHLICLGIAAALLFPLIYLYKAVFMLLYVKFKLKRA